MNLERQYRTRFVIGILAYIVLVPVSITLLRGIEGSGLRMVVALLPLLPTLFVVFRLPALPARPGRTSAADPPGSAGL